MNKHVGDSFPEITPINPTQPDNDFIREQVDRPNGSETVEAYAKAQFRFRNPKAAGASANEAELGRVRASLAEQWQRLDTERKSTENFSTAFIGKRKERLAFHDAITYLLYFAFSFGGIGLGIHCLAVYISNSDTLPGLSGNYFQSLLFSLAPACVAIVIKAGASFTKNDVNRNLYYKNISIVAVVSGAIFVLSAAICFAPHQVDVSALTDALTKGIDPSDAWSKLVNSVAAHVYLVSQLCTEITAAVVISARSDKLHTAGRDIQEKASSRRQAIEADLARIEQKLKEVSEAEAIASLEASQFEQGEAAAVDAARAKFAEEEIDFRAFLVKKTSDFKNRRT